MFEVVMSSQLGSCWLPKRFIPSERCSRVNGCKKPEKATCKAVDVEIIHLKKRQEDIAARIQKNIEATQRHIEKLSNDQVTIS